MSPNPLVETRDLTKHFAVRRSMLKRDGRHVRALEKVDLAIEERETLGVVGESGCGKTTLGRVVLRLIPPTAGQVLFEGQDITSLGHRQIQRLRSNMQMVFQNPYDSFDPRFSVLKSISEPLKTHTRLRGMDLIARAGELLEQTGMPGDIIHRYPHEFSGGQLQRIAVARALALNPKFIVLDEPTSSLDVSVQAQIINLLQVLQREKKLTYMFISHDLSVVQHISDRIAVMYLGTVVELSTTEAIFQAALHPYTKALLAAAPSLDPEYRQERLVLEGGVPDPADPPPGCGFHPRCPVVMAKCSSLEPRLVDAGNGHLVACHRVSG
jgi:oligopeptide/dipeptide ABC transporter ATP-binding protein